MELKDYYKKKNHKVTIKEYGFIDWYLYHYYNERKFKLVADLIYVIYIIIICIITSYITVTIISRWY